MNSRRYFLKVFYIGSEHYYGSQRQDGFQTIENCLIDALKSTMYIEDINSAKFEAASRTDKLVSARGAVFSFKTNKEPILMEINSKLPKDIGVWAFCQVPDNFLSRYNAISRLYKYILPTSYYKEGKKIKVLFKKIRKACYLTSGKHDFVNFSKKSSKETKTIRDLKVSIEKKKNFMILNFKSRAYLRQQIRKIISKLLEVGTNNLTLKEYLTLFDPSKQVPITPADPKGLILWDIDYGDVVNFIYDKKSIQRMIEFINKSFSYHNTKSKLFHIIQHDNFC